MGPIARLRFRHRNFAAPAAAVACALLACAFAHVAAASEEDGAGAESRLDERLVRTSGVSTLRATMTPIDASLLGETPPALQGTLCTQISTHTNANFSGGQFVVQAGFAEQEIAAAQYVIPAVAFPIKIELSEMIFATSNATMSTTTQWTWLVWEGPPNTGTLVASFSSDNVILPHIVLPPGTSGVNVQVSVDPGDPEQVIINDNPSHSFTIGYRIDDHNQQTGNPCFTAPPSCCNAFPTTDVGGLASPSRNWLFGVNCGPFGCPANGGWSSFAALPFFCVPTGDWVIRATWSSLSCTQAAGACCISGGFCDDATSIEDCASLAGTFQGDQTTCANTPCDFGACCVGAQCSQSETPAHCTSLGGTYQGDGTTCLQVTCGSSTGACCVSDGEACVDDVTTSTCATLGGLFRGVGSDCETDDCPGACCLANGSCVEALVISACAAQGGSFQGGWTECATANCPVPPGACCFVATGGCLNNFTAQNCAIASGIFQGGGTTCAQIVCFPEGACCLPNGSCLDGGGAGLSPAACAAQGGAFQGDGTACATTNCPLPTGACCFAAGCIVLVQSDCTVAGGSWALAGTTCADANLDGVADACCTTSCEGDVDGNGSVGFADLTSLLLEWGPCPGCCPEDVDGNGAVGFADLTLLLIGWGDC